MALTNIIRSVVPAALGFGSSAGSLEKLTILYEKGGAGQFYGEIKALFNPNSFSITTAVEWKEEKSAVPEAGYVLRPPKSYPAPTLSLDLFFDTYEGDPLAAGSSFGQSLKKAVTGGVLGSSLGASPSGVSLVKYTQEIARLARMDQELHRPPICLLKWGKLQIFEGVLTSLTQKYTLFMSDGTPVRATLTCSFKQYQSAQQAMMELDLHSADVPKTHVVRRGDTLSRIAAVEYNDASLWRKIAQANGIVNPRALTPGQVLKIPKLV
jgi:nucleoid-associated protein YgaU